MQLTVAVRLQTEAVNVKPEVSASSLANQECVLWRDKMNRIRDEADWPTNSEVPPVRLQ